MKRIHLALAFSCFFSMTYAQTNTVDVGLYGLFLRTINLSYEKATTKNQSFQLKAGYTIPRKLPTILIEPDGTSTELEIRNKLAGFSVVGEYRFYVKKEEALRGFYIAPYLKFNNYTLEFSDTIDGIESIATGGCNTFSLGGQLGYQWLVSDKFVIDMGFFGLGVARNSLSIKYETDDPDVNFEELAKDLEAEATDWTFFGGKISVEAEADHVKVKAPFMGLGLRFNLGLGYAF